MHASTRHHSARDWNVDKAYKMLTNSLKWRDAYGPERLTPDTIEEGVVDFAADTSVTTSLHIRVCARQAVHAR